jgi:hypothetical protein
MPSGSQTRPHSLPAQMCGWTLARAYAAIESGRIEAATGL